MMLESKSLSDLNVISLFSGIGGLDLGLHDFGIATKAFLEFDKACCATLNANRELFGNFNKDIEPIDITKTEPEDFYPGVVDLIVGGPPCQSFSAAGRRAGGVPGTNDARGVLFWRYKAYLEHFKPKAFIFENVKGILSSNKGEDFKTISSAFTESGYTLEHAIINAADFGAPQIRERLFLIGIRSDLNASFKFPRPTHGEHSTERTPYTTSKDAIGHLEGDAEDVPPYGGKYGDLLNDIPPGENYRFYTEEMGHPNPRFAWRSKFSGFLYKLDPNDVSRTIVAQQGRYDGPFHWHNRKCTPEELKLLQGFPEKFRLHPNKSQSVKQIGNSVAPPVGRALLSALLFQLGYEMPQRPELIDDTTIYQPTARRQRLKKASSRKKRLVQYGNQPDLFSREKALYKDFSRKESVKYRKLNFTISIRSKEGKIAFEIQEGNAPKRLGTIRLDFFAGIQHQIRSIEAVIFGSGIESISLSWQTVHRLVGEITSYDSLMPLHGHFTEPYRKFDMKVELVSDDILIKILSKFSNFEFCDRVHSIDVIELPKLVDFSEAAKTLREFGYDVRTHNTNRTIPAGYFRCCYPFSTPESEKRYVVWTDVGESKKFDLK
jgi:DNA (cytosine-5)-methyltransferase 1